MKEMLLKLLKNKAMYASLLSLAAGYGIAVNPELLEHVSQILNVVIEAVGELDPEVVAE